MTLAAFLAACDALRADAERDVQAATTLDEWTEVRNQLVGRKSGRLTQLMAQVPALASEERRDAGQAINALKSGIDALLESRHAALSTSSRDGHPKDLTLPARREWKGARHPVSIVVDDIVAIFRKLGFTVALGPEVEWEWYNFGALNFPANHPAMDLHDTLYLTGDMLLRTHTSPVQVRTLQMYDPPVRILAPGNVYRHDMFDATHAPAFAQLEGMVVDEERVVDAVELDGLPERRVHDAGLAQDRGCVSADAIQAIEGPRHAPGRRALRRVGRARTGVRHGKERKHECSLTTEKR